MRKYKPPERLGRPPNCRWISGHPPDPPDLWYSSSLEDNRSFTDNQNVELSYDNYAAPLISICVLSREMAQATKTFIYHTQYARLFD